MILALVATITAYSAVERVQPHEKRVLTVFDEYRRLLEPGLNLVPPFVSSTHPFDMRTRTLDIPPQALITSDGVSVTVNAVVYAKVMDPKRAFLEVDDHERAVVNLAQTTLRAVLSDMELAALREERDEINTRVRAEMDSPTDAWGVRVEAVELREVTPEEQVQRAIELSGLAAEDPASVTDHVPELRALLDEGSVEQEHALDALFELARVDPGAVRPALMELESCAQAADELVRRKASRILELVGGPGETGTDTAPTTEETPERCRELRTEAERIGEALDDAVERAESGEPQRARTELVGLEPELRSVAESAAEANCRAVENEVSELERRLQERLGAVTDRLKRPPDPDEIPPVPAVSVDTDALTDERVIGSGGNAEVIRATLPSADGDIVLAIKRPRLSGTIRTEEVERLLDEAETWAKLDDHDHVVGVVDYGSSPLPWIAMEYMDGGSLDTRAGEMDALEALWTAIAITKAVRYAHRQGVAHLDLKPENVLFRTIEGAWDLPKVADWGLSKHLLDHSNSVEGLTPEYAAPEQFDPEYGTTDDLTDVYQLGAVFYELFTGQPPFEGSPQAVLRAVVDDRPTPPSELADVPAGLDEILLTALARKKTDRYESVLYLRDDLQELYGEG